MGTLRHSNAWGLMQPDAPEAVCIPPCATAATSELSSPLQPFLFFFQTILSSVSAAEIYKKIKACYHKQLPFPTLEPTLPEVPLQPVQEMIEKKDALARVIT